MKLYDDQIQIRLLSSHPLEEVSKSRIASILSFSEGGYSFSKTAPVNESSIRGGMDENVLLPILFQKTKNENNSDKDMPFNGFNYKPFSALIASDVVFSEKNSLPVNLYYLDNVNNLSLPSWFDAIRNRMLEYRRFADEDGEAFSDSSYDEALEFSKKLRGIRMPFVFLVSGDIRFLWKNDNKDQIGIRFIGGGMVSCVFYRSFKWGEKSVAADLKINEFMALIDICKDWVWEIWREC